MYTYIIHYFFCLSVFLTNPKPKPTLRSPFGFWTLVSTFWIAFAWTVENVKRERDKKGERKRDNNGGEGETREKHQAHENTQKKKKLPPKNKKNFME